MTLAARKFHVVDPSLLSDSALLADAAAEVARHEETTPKWQPSDEGKGKLRAKAEERARLKAVADAEAAKAIAKPFVIYSVDLPDPGAVNPSTALTFFRTVNDVKATTLDIVIAIASFVGYDRFAPFGVQEFNARWTAMATLRPTTLLRMARIPRTVGGFVAGMPNEDRKLYLDLVGRESLALNAMLDAEALISANDVKPEVAAELRSMAREHSDALDAIRQSLRDFANSMGLVGED